MQNIDGNASKKINQIVLNNYYWLGDMDAIHEWICEQEDNQDDVNNYYWLGDMDAIDEWICEQEEKKGEVMYRELT